MFPVDCLTKVFPGREEPMTVRMVKDIRGMARLTGRVVKKMRPGRRRRARLLFWG